MQFVFSRGNIHGRTKTRFKLLKLSREIHLIGIIQRITRQNDLYKRKELSLLKGLSYEEMDRLAKQFYEEKIIPELVTETNDELKKKQKEGYRIVIVSGAFDIYLKYFCMDNGVYDIIATTLDFQNGKFQGKWSGTDCMREEKINRYERWMKDNHVTGKPAICYSDSITDLPILKYCNEAVVISRNNHQHWIDQYHFNEIVWNK